MKKIGIDARLLGQTGVGVYIRNLLFWSRKHIPKDWSIYVYVLPEDIRKLNFPSEQFIIREANFKWHSLREQSSFLQILNSDQLDLMHFTYFSYPIFYNKPFISTIHDLTHILNKSGKASTQNNLIYWAKYKVAKKILKTQVQKAKYVITPTQTVKSQIEDYFGEEYAQKIVATHEGVDEKLKTAKENKILKSKFNRKFAIYVGNFYPHKNVENLIKAFLAVNKDLSLILIGPDDFFSRRIHELILDLRLNERIIFYKHASPQDLVFFYKNASMLINPSKAEGFGLTNLEALYFSCPVVASDIPVFREVLGTSFDAFDPKDPDDITRKINTALSKKTKTESGELMNKYSFEKMTKETIKLYQKALNI